MWILKSVSHAWIPFYENLANKPYFCLGLLVKLPDPLIPVNVISITLGFFDILSPSRDGIPLGTLDNYWAKWTFLKFDVFRTPLEAGRSITSETDGPLLAGISCTCGTVCNIMTFYDGTLGSWLGVLMGSSSRSGANQVSYRSILSIAPLGDLCFTRSVQFGVFCDFPHE